MNTLPVMSNDLCLELLNHEPETNITLSFVLEEEEGEGEEEEMITWLYWKDGECVCTCGCGVSHAKENQVFIRCGGAFQITRF